ncbi:MAG: hypothetical protein MZU79_08690 [Anaerotruncus sp.]|nr:hypothetical protein [Anaerotruncus sp.]
MKIVRRHHSPSALPADALDDKTPFARPVAAGPGRHDAKFSPGRQTRGETSLQHAGSIDAAAAVIDQCDEHAAARS